eukprot:126465-Pyramimonas_sp.AAC.1
MWMRKLAPIRRQGPHVVTDVNDLRPIGHVDDAEGFLDDHRGWLTPRACLRRSRGTCRPKGCPTVP